MTLVLFAVDNQLISLINITECETPSELRNKWNRLKQISLFSKGVNMNDMCMYTSFLFIAKHALPTKTPGIMLTILRCGL
mmetsp:Transcript_15506/g.18403  ORF Transcript_15506/g.18403 Transcript_15506/m.18403 type:complete len:80 (-) Transcript_15506:91-330(-)